MDIPAFKKHIMYAYIRFRVYIIFDELNFLYATTHVNPEYEFQDGDVGINTVYLYKKDTSFLYQFIFTDKTHNIPTDVYEIESGIALQSKICFTYIE